MRYAKIKTNYYDNHISGVKAGEIVKYQGELYRVKKVGEYDSDDGSVRVDLEDIPTAVSLND